jgi:hypothetical protein
MNFQYNKSEVCLKFSSEVTALYKLNDSILIKEAYQIRWLHSWKLKGGSEQLIGKK